jgi:hypothetical protein
MKKLLLLLITAFTITTSNATITDEESNLYESILCMNFENPEIVWAQAILETGHLKSKLCKNYNNLFGMKMARKRYTLATGRTNHGYAVYNSKDSSLADYLVWQNVLIKKKGSMSSTAYMNYINMVYCETPGYSKQLKQILRKNRGHLSAIKRMQKVYNNHLFEMGVKYTKHKTLIMKINRKNLYDHLVKYELNVIGKTIEEVKEDKWWFSNNTFTTEQHEEFKKYAIELIKKTLKLGEKKAKLQFSWFDLQYGLKVDEKI